MKINIKNLLLRTIIGLNSWERTKKQDIILNISIETNIEKATKTDSIEDSINYRTLNKKIINEVEKTSFFLLERLAAFVLDLIFEYDKVDRATVEIDKPNALRFAKSVSIQLSRKR